MHLNSIRFLLLRWLILFFFVLIVLLVALSPLRIHGHTAEALVTFQMFVEGSVHYGSVQTGTTVMGDFLHLIPVLIAALTSMNPIRVFMTMVVLLSGGAVLVSNHLLKREQGDFPQWLPSVIIAGFLVATLQTLLTNQFGQPNHLAMILYFPGFLLRWLSSHQHIRGGRLPVFIGVSSAIGVLLQPLLLISILMLELYWLMEHRDPRRLLKPEVFGFVGALFLYSLCGLLAVKAIISPISQLSWLPPNYMAISYQNILDVLDGSPFLLAIGIFPFILRPLSSDSSWNLIQSLAILTIVNLLGAAIQGTEGDSLIPAYIAGIITVLTGAFYLPRIQLGDVAWQFSLAQAVLLCTLLFAFYNSANFSQAFLSLNADLPEMRQLIRQYSMERDPILVLSPNLQIHVLLMQEKRRSLYPFQFAQKLRLDPMNDRETARQTTINDLKDKVNQWHPPLVILSDDSSCADCGGASIELEFNNIRTSLEEIILPTYQYKGRGNSNWVYHYIGEPLHPFDAPVHFGNDILLNGWDLASSTEVKPCTNLVIHSWWQAQNDVVEYYNISVGLAQDGIGVTHKDGPPSGIDTPGWQAGDRRADERTLEVPCNISVGDYSLLVSLYPVNTSQFELVPVTYDDGTLIGNYFYLTQITVTP